MSRRVVRVSKRRNLFIANATLKESIATIPEMIRAFPTFQNFPDFVRTLPKAKNAMCEDSIATIPETIRALPIFPELSRSLKTTVRGIDCDYSRNDPSPSDLAHTLPKLKIAVFGVFTFIFKSKESIMRLFLK
ncbi:hypothetical protein NQ317_010216 [Molorchus minor]|uniref:Uncharacterized protein n=1 Tax=Molorchus minor TaxID=1323400 RepID=A0ABQ9JQ73_9CUCU|nr:hypothetical protein NQ317_010216 [Molorchus minor]